MTKIDLLKTSPGHALHRDTTVQPSVNSILPDRLEYIGAASDVGRRDPKAQQRQLATGQEAASSCSIFQEHWWLDAVTQGRYREARVLSDGRQVARLPYYVRKKVGFTIGQMPPFTRVLGPVVEPLQGKAQTQLRRRLSIVRQLLEQLPDCHLFWFALDPNPVDALALQDSGFELWAQYTFEIDCKASLDALFAGMHIKARQPIRRAEEKFAVKSIEDPHEFIHFYLENLKKTGSRNNIDWGTFPALFQECRARASGEILSATWPDGRHAAMIFLVWGHGKMYYLLSTRAGDEGDVGSINLLIWEGMKRAHARGLIFDFDCINTSGATTFLSGFNGVPKMRIFARRLSSGYGLIYLARQLLRLNGQRPRPERLRT